MSLNETVVHSSPWNWVQDVGPKGTHINRLSILDETTYHVWTHISILSIRFSNSLLNLSGLLVQGNLSSYLAIRN